jgi:hypothetical protein
MPNIILLNVLYIIYSKEYLGSNNVVGQGNINASKEVELLKKENELLKRELELERKEKEFLKSSKKA